MRLNKTSQAALLFCIYLKMNGLSKTTAASEHLQISVHFLEQIARKLKDAGVIIPVRGPGGGYFIEGDATVGAVLAAIKEKGLIASADYHGLNSSTREADRVLAGFALSASVQIAKLQQITLSELINQNPVLTTQGVATYTPTVFV